MDSQTDKFPQPRRKFGGAPCGECRLPPGEVCDICGACWEAEEPEINCDV